MGQRGRVAVPDPGPLAVASSAGWSRPWPLSQALRIHFLPQGSSVGRAPYLRVTSQAVSAEAPPPSCFGTRGGRALGAVCFLRLRPTFSWALPLGRAQPLMQPGPLRAAGPNVTQRERESKDARGRGGDGQPLAAKSGGQRLAPTGSGAGWSPLSTPTSCAQPKSAPNSLLCTCLLNEWR